MTRAGGDSAVRDPATQLDGVALGLMPLPLQVLLRFSPCFSFFLTCYLTVAMRMVVSKIHRQELEDGKVCARVHLCVRVYTSVYTPTQCTSLHTVISLTYEENVGSGKIR